MSSLSQKTLNRLQRYESQNVTLIEPDGSWPIVWDRAKGVSVWDVDGRHYLDLTAAFGVAAAGHGNSRVVKAGQNQMGRLLHAMGDVHPHPRKAELVERLSRITFERWSPDGTEIGKTILANSGFEAVEAALKTAMLATGRPEILAFEGAYHGLGYGSLNATYRSHFRTPFLPQLKEFAHFVPFPVTGASPEEEKTQMQGVETRITALLRRNPVGAILVEPIQGRGGIRVPPPRFLSMLRSLCNQFGCLLIADEVYTGFGRTGAWLGCDHSGIIPDLICLGKALTGGFPLSACVGRAEVMDAAWPKSDGEAIHTSTFLGHPVGCAMALAQITEIEERDLISRAARTGHYLREELERLSESVTDLQLFPQGLGLMAGLKVNRPDGSPAVDTVTRLVKELLNAGYILLPEGDPPNVLSFTPPLTISRKQLTATVNELSRHLSTTSAS